MPGWYLDAMIRLQGPYEKWRFRRMTARRLAQVARCGSGAVKAGVGAPPRQGGA